MDTAASLLCIDWACRIRGGRLASRELGHFLNPVIRSKEPDGAGFASPLSGGIALLGALVTSPLGKQEAGGSRSAELKADAAEGRAECPRPTKWVLAQHASAALASDWPLRPKPQVPSGQKPNRLKAGQFGRPIDQPAF